MALTSLILSYFRPVAFFDDTFDDVEKQENPRNPSRLPALPTLQGMSNKWRLSLFKYFIPSFVETVDILLKRFHPVDGVSVVNDKDSST